MRKKLSILGGAIIFLDQFTKSFVRGFMCEWESIPVLPFLNITYITNRGIAWGLFSTVGSNYLFTALNIAAVVFLFVNYVKFKKNKLTAIAWTMIVAGAIGNLGDRIFLGAVVDFLDFGIKIGAKEYRWPVFNVADSSITIGAIMLFVGLLNGKKQLENIEPQMNTDEHKKS